MTRSRFDRRDPFHSATYRCVVCGKLTRETGDGESHVDLCRRCYREAGVENFHSDDGHRAKSIHGCPQCEKAGYGKDYIEG